MKFDLLFISISYKTIENIRETSEINRFIEFVKSYKGCLLIINIYRGSEIMLVVFDIGRK